MNPLPLPVRLAAGLVATAVEQARDLPRLVIEFPVTAVSQALQASMRVQQRVTELAIKGDRALGALRPVEEKPSWATFDEDESPPYTNGASTVTELRPAPRRPAQRVAVERPAVPTAPPAPAPPSAPTAPSAPAPSAPPSAAAAPDAPTTAAAAAELVASAPVDAPADGPTGESPLPGFDAMSIAQLRGKLRTLSPDELRALLAWEQTHQDRPAYVTMLGNRIATVSEE